jgi:cation diffusion facilitator CzcD-associated flavoprotein CzcO
MASSLRSCHRSHSNANAISVWSHLYSFSFHQNPCWTQLYPTQKEILTYLVSVAEHYSLYQHIRFNCETQSCSWSDERSTWNVNIKVHGGKDKEVRSEYNLECDFLISAVGQLNYPRYPSVAGIDDFEGRIMHSARWDWSYDYKGKRVAVVGSGETPSYPVCSCSALLYSN